jgi:hypothetical protein
MAQRGKSRATSEAPVQKRMEIANATDLTAAVHATVEELDHYLDEHSAGRND